MKGENVTYPAIGLCVRRLHQVTLYNACRLNTVIRSRLTLWGARLVPRHFRGLHVLFMLSLTFFAIPCLNVVADAFIVQISMTKCNICRTIACVDTIIVQDRINPIGDWFHDVLGGLFLFLSPLTSLATPAFLKRRSVALLRDNFEFYIVFCELSRIFL